MGESGAADEGEREEIQEDVGGRLCDEEGAPHPSPRPHRLEDAGGTGWSSPRGPSLDLSTSWRAGAGTGAGSPTGTETGPSRTGPASGPSPSRRGGGSSGGSGGWGKATKAPAGSLRAAFQKAARLCEADENRMTNLVIATGGLLHRIDPLDPRLRSRNWGEALVLEDRGLVAPFRVALLRLVSMTHKDKDSSVARDAAPVCASSSSTSLNGAPIGAVAAQSEVIGPHILANPLIDEAGRAAGGGRERGAGGNIVGESSPGSEGRKQGQANDETIGAPASPKRLRPVAGDLVLAFFKAEACVGIGRQIGLGCTLRVYDPIFLQTKNTGSRGGGGGDGGVNVGTCDGRVGAGGGVGSGFGFAIGMSPQQRLLVSDFSVCGLAVDDRVNGEDDRVNGEDGRDGPRDSGSPCTAQVGKFVALVHLWEIVPQ